MTPCPHQIGRIMAVMEAAFDPAFGEAWNERQVTDALTMPTTRALIIDAAGLELKGVPSDDSSEVPAGFVLTRQAADEEELLLVAVLPEHRRNGLARKLIERLLTCARERGVTRIFLEMRRGNPAIHLYEKVGFEPIGQRSNYYRMANGSRADAITFGLTV